MRLYFAVDGSAALRPLLEVKRKYLE